MFNVTQYNEKKNVIKTSHMHDLDKYEMDTYESEVTSPQ